MARPTRYKAEYAKQALKLCILGLTDKEIGYFFDVSEVTINTWKKKHTEFFVSITPSQERIDNREIRVQAQKNQRNASNLKRRSSSPSERIADSMRSRLWAAMKGKKTSMSILSFTSKELRFHLQNKFKEGMRWSNYGKWHIDHIKPCSSYDLTNKEEFADCWSIKNLQPLWAHENLKKGAKYASS